MSPVIVYFVRTSRRNNVFYRRHIHSFTLNFLDLVVILSKILIERTSNIFYSRNWLKLMKNLLKNYQNSEQLSTLSCFGKNHKPKNREPITIAYLLFTFSTIQWTSFVSYHITCFSHVELEFQKNILNFSFSLGTGIEMNSNSI